MPYKRFVEEEEGWNGKAEPDTVIRVMDLWLQPPPQPQPQPQPRRQPLNSAAFCFCRRHKLYSSSSSSSSSSFKWKQQLSLSSSSSPLLLSSSSSSNSPAAAIRVVISNGRTRPAASPQRSQSLYEDENNYNCVLQPEEQGQEEQKEHEQEEQKAERGVVEPGRQQLGWWRRRRDVDVDEEDGGFVCFSGNSGTIISSCVVGVLTGVAVVLFNTTVHEMRDFFWDGIAYRGASWLREEPLDSTWTRVILVPVFGGFIVSILNALRSALFSPSHDDHNPSLKAAFGPFLKAMAACFTLGTGNSLGPEGPSVEIGASIAKGLSSLPLFDQKSSPSNSLSLLAAGSAAGIASGFNAAVAGCFFAVESVLWPSPTSESSISLTNTTSTVILSAVIASVVSEVGLGSQPAFKVPDYDFRSPGELPLYLLLGILCGLVSLTLSRCTSFMSSTVNNLHQVVGVPRVVFPVVGSLAVGIIALAYPEILYWGFENVDILLESRPFVKALSADLLLQLVGAKIVATSLCRASGLVGGYYAPSLFIGAATGMAYGKFISFAVSQADLTIKFPILEAASPQAYGLVGMAATLAGVCQVPLTAVLLLFELTQDYRIVLPLLGAVGLSSWITSGQTRRRDVKEASKLNEGNNLLAQQLETVSSDKSWLSSGHVLSAKELFANNLCEVESSLCIEVSNIEMEVFKENFVSDAMITRYVTVLMSTPLTEALTLMLAEKQSCALIVDDENILIGLLTFANIEQFSKIAKGENRRIKEFLVSDLCSVDGEKCRVPWTAKPEMALLSVQITMDRLGVSHVPVVSDYSEGQRGRPVGLLDRQCISLAYRAVAARESLRKISL